MSMQQHDPRGRWGRTSLLAVAAAALVGVGAFSASEAWAARSAVFTADCGEYNWCRQGPGAGDTNCDECCVLAGQSFGLCLDYRDLPELQGCLCGD